MMTNTDIEKNFLKSLTNIIIRITFKIYKQFILIYSYHLLLLLNNNIIFLIQNSINKTNRTNLK